MEIIGVGRWKIPVLDSGMVEIHTKKRAEIN